MKEMTLCEVQSVSMKILSVIDAFCINNNINYSLGYGSLIGAIRHKGCIPWDDDIDIIMTRSNYDKFISLFSCEGYKLYAPELGNCYHSIARICEMKLTKVWKKYAWTDETTGVWVDLFVYEYAANEDINSKLRRQVYRCFKACTGHVHLSPKFSFVQNLIIIKHWICRGHLNRRKEIILYQQILFSALDNTTDMMRNYSSPYNIKDTHPAQVFDNYIRVTFGGIKVNIIGKYDIYLKNLYGDYMTPPPTQECVRGHDQNKYYWL